MSWSRTTMRGSCAWSRPCSRSADIASRPRSAEDAGTRGFRLGADDYVTKPFRFEELDLRVAKTLRRTAQAMQDTRDQINTSGLRGDLSQVGLSSLLVLIEMERKTGLLQL